MIYKHHTADTGVAGKQFILPKSKELAFADGRSTPLEVGIRYRPRRTTFPVIDSWLLAGPAPRDPAILLGFQITLDKDEHDANQRGLIVQSVASSRHIISPQTVAWRLRIHSTSFIANMR